MWFFWTLRVLLQRWCSTCLVLVNTPTPRENRERQESRIFLNLQKNTIFNEHPVPLFSKENIFSWDGKMVNWMVKIFTKAIVWMCAINSARDDLSFKLRNTQLLDVFWRLLDRIEAKKMQVLMFLAKSCGPKPAPYPNLWPLKIITFLTSPLLCYIMFWPSCHYVEVSPIGYTICKAICMSNMKPALKNKQTM